MSQHIPTVCSSCLLETWGPVNPPSLLPEESTGPMRNCTQMHPLPVGERATLTSHWLLSSQPRWSSNPKHSKNGQTNGFSWSLERAHFCFLLPPHSLSSFLPSPPYPPHPLWTHPLPNPPKEGADLPPLVFPPKSLCLLRLQQLETTSALPPL